MTNSDLGPPLHQVGRYQFKYIILYEHRDIISLSCNKLARRELTTSQSIKIEKLLRSLALKGLAPAEHDMERNNPLFIGICYECGSDS